MSIEIRNKKVTTRKPHRCFGCGRTFPTGTQMDFSVFVDDGIFNCYLCKSCQKVAYDIGDEFCFGDLLEDALELEMEEEKRGAEL